MQMESLRVLLAIAANLDWEAEQMDVVGAYLNSELEEMIYMRQPIGFTDGMAKVTWLNKSLYGLKQSGRVWNTKLNDTFQRLGFERLEADRCIYKRQNNNEFIVIAVHMDDMAIFGNSVSATTRVKGELSQQFEVKDLGPIKTIIGLEVTQDCQKKTITLSQPHYICTILKRFGMEKSTLTGTLLDANIKLQKGMERMEDILYAE